jgi:hypothetical protein
LKNTNKNLLSLEVSIGKPLLYVKEILPQNVVLDTDDRSGNGFIFRNRILEKTLQRSPGAAAQIGKEFSIIQKVTAEYFRDAEYKMSMRNLLEDVHAQPLPEFHQRFKLRYACFQRVSLIKTTQW